MDGLAFCITIGVVGRPTVCRCHPARSESAETAGSLNRETKSSVFISDNGILIEVGSNLYLNVRNGDRHFLFQPKELQTWGRAWIRQMGRCKADMQEISGKTIYSEHTSDKTFSYQF